MLSPAGWSPENTGLSPRVRGNPKEELDPKTVHTLLRHAHVHTTVQIDAHRRNEDRMTAQGDRLTAFFRAVCASGAIAITGELRVSVYL